jgi:hypothetical protein
MFFEIPSDWRVFQEADLAGSADTPFVNQALLDLPVLSRVVFTGSAAGDLVTDPSAANVPIGSAVVRSISSGTRDYISRYYLAEMVVPYHSETSAQVVAKSDLDLGHGFDGVQVVVRYVDTTTNTEAVVAFIAVTDPAVTKMYSIAVGCTTACFIDQQQTITDIVDSWLVNTR